MWIAIGVWAVVVGLGLWGIARWAEKDRGGHYFNEHDHSQYR